MINTTNTPSPIVDIDLNFRNPITNTRTFGSNKNMVKKCGVNYINSLQKYGLAGCAKHFPADGVDERDQHLVTSINSLTISGNHNKITFQKEILNLIINGSNNKINASHRNCLLSNVVFNGSNNKIEVGPNSQNVCNILIF